eukprot:2403954-Rhodomonas_salina.3
MMYGPHLLVPTARLISRLVPAPIVAVSASSTNLYQSTMYATLPWYTTHYTFRISTRFWNVQNPFSFAMYDSTRR